MTDIIQHTITYSVTDLNKYLDSIDELDQKLSTYGMDIISRNFISKNVFCLVCNIDHDHPKNSQIMTANEEYGWEYKILEVPISQMQCAVKGKKIIEEMKEIIDA